MTWLKDIGGVPIPTLFVVGGILFWFLAIAGSIAGQITVEPSMRRTAQLVGTAFIVLGLILSVIENPKPNPSDSPAAAAASTPAPAAASTPTPAAASTPTPAATPPVTPTPAAASSAASALAEASPAEPTSKLVSPATGLSPSTHPKPTTTSHSQPPPAVNCSGNGTPDETAICSNPILTDLEWQLHDRFYSMLSGLDQVHRAQLLRAESTWVKQRRLCKRDTECLVSAYKLRLDQLK